MCEAYCGGYAKGAAMKQVRRLKEAARLHTYFTLHIIVSFITSEANQESNPCKHYGIINYHTRTELYGNNPIDPSIQ
jgi:hypothetical protein